MHRVVTPPADQIHIPRLGLLYFSRPGSNVLMEPVPSPLLERLGILTGEDRDRKQVAVTGTDYVRARVKDVHFKDVFDMRKGTEFVFKGLRVQNHYE